MLRKLRVILKYYDSEPMEILLGIVWLLFFPAIWTSQFGFQTMLITISLLLGISLIKGTCIESLRARKTLAYGSFLFSIVIIVLLFLNKGILNSGNWFWLMPVLMSTINLMTVTSQYYRKQKS
jgi:hypothetical protein|tara:strand:+ start:435 stop:803 length:369 start_codon:yes stop_codon:yes gene_type:complete